MGKKKKSEAKFQPVRHWPLHLHHRGSQAVILIVLAGLILISHFGRVHLLKPATQIIANPSQVSITLNGFNPPVLTVKTGSPVTWHNDDTRPHQIVADTNPDSSVPLGFDDNLVLRTGDSYTFSFIHPGTYTYHDQLSPGSNSGTIIVQ